MGVRHRPLLLLHVHAQSCLTFCDPMDWSLLGSFCSWDAQIRQIKVVGCWGVECPPSSAHTHGAQCVGVGCFTPFLALCQLFFLARRPLVKRGWGGYVCVCVCHEFFRVLPLAVASRIAHGEKISVNCMKYSSLFLFCAQLFPTLCDPHGLGPPASSVHGIFQARILEWVANSYFRGSSQPRDQTHISCVSCICRQILYH